MEEEEKRNHHESTCRKTLKLKVTKGASQFQTLTPAAPRKAFRIHTFSPERHSVQPSALQRSWEFNTWLLLKSQEQQRLSHTHTHRLQINTIKTVHVHSIRCLLFVWLYTHAHTHSLACHSEREGEQEADILRGFLWVKGHVCVLFSSCPPGGQYCLNEPLDLQMRAPVT